ncbi:VanW family protein [Actinomyces sp. ZJ308]|uniref:VanW family protein n=1 Tax=Actinomyces sp. ZJ308 TaxID=2708342 RepID=UPI0014225CB5|nr:VanW family protein [Actinomyces sp. ZJ308]
MSQSVNRGEKSAASAASPEVVESVEPVASAQPDDAAAPPADAASPDDTPTVNLDDDSHGSEAGPVEAPDGETRGAQSPAEGAQPVTDSSEGESTEETAQGPEERENPTVAPSEPAAETPAKQPAEPQTTSDPGETAPDTMPTVRLTGSLSRPADGAGAEKTSAPPQTEASADERDDSVDPEPGSAESVAAEPVATPASVDVVDEAATPAEALSPYDLTGADARTAATAEPGERAARSPQSEGMPPSIAPKSPAAASSASAQSQSEPQPEAAVVADAAEPAGVYLEPTGEAAFPAALPEPATKAEKSKKPGKAGKFATKTDEAAAGPTASRRRRLIPAACAAGAAAFLLAWGGIAWWTTQHIASGTSVSGVDVSGLGPKEARARVSKGVGDQLAQPVTLTVGQGSSELVPAGSGVSVDTDASVKRLTGFTLNPVTLAQRLSGQRTDAVIRVDGTTLRGALEDRVDTMANGAVSATVTLEGTRPVTTPASNGVGLDVDASVKRLTGSWPLGQKTIAMPEGTAVPAITDEEATTFVDGTLNPLLASGLTVDGAGAGAQGQSVGGAAAAFSPHDTAGMLRISSEGGTLSATFDPTALHDAVVARIGQVETPAQNATWRIDGSAAGAPGARPQYVPSAQGKVIDTAALSESLLKAGTSATDVAGRTVALPMVVAEPTVTTPQNEWGISEPIGEYATPYNSGDVPRTQNLTRGAELVNGTVVKPGEVFSLEQTLGEVDYDHGFADAGVISNGQHVDSLGGGLSQVATTVFNAGFEAGMDDTEHHAHQYYFDRYPAGREATLWTGRLDVKFTNSTSSSVLVQAWLDGEQIHVRLWSTKYYDVSITSSERFNFRPVSTERKSGPGCEPYSGGNPGFDITVTRTRKHDGKALPDDVLTTQYAADNNIVCS